MDSEESKERDGVNAQSNDSRGITSPTNWNGDRWTWSDYNIIWASQYSWQYTAGYSVIWS